MYVSQLALASLHVYVMYVFSYVCMYVCMYVCVKVVGHERLAPSKPRGHCEQSHSEAAARNRHLMVG